jgi:hypothetical protein
MLRQGAAYLGSLPRKEAITVMLEAGGGIMDTKLGE